MSTEHKAVLIFWGVSLTKVTIPEITDTDLVTLLKSSGMGDEEAAAVLRGCCTAERVRILRKLRGSLLDGIHEKQAVLDKVDNLIWAAEHGGTL